MRGRSGGAIETWVHEWGEAGERDSSGVSYSGLIAVEIVFTSALGDVPGGHTCVKVISCGYCFWLTYLPRRTAVRTSSERFGG